MRLRTSDVALFQEIFVESQYCWKLPMYPSVIVDGGANIGLTSVFFANRYPQAKILAIEPEASNFEMLMKNTEPYSNITAVCAALWKENCVLSLLNPEADPWGFWGYRTEELGKSQQSVQSVSVRAVTLGELMREYSLDGVDLLKLDIEGAEKEVFENCSGWIDRVGAIAIELHDRFKGGCTDSVLTATKDFGLRWQSGEITFLFRKELVAGPSRHGGLMADLSHPGLVGLSLPLRVRVAT
jgi:FkbM family methyltransferase